MEKDLNGFKKRWEELGISGSLYQMIGQWGIKKFLKRTESPDFLVLNIAKSQISCLDIDNIGESILKFHELVDSMRIDLNDYLIEKTLHGGYHIFFIRNPETRRINLYAQEKNGIKYDMLHNGRVFTTPSSYMGKGYHFLSKTPHSIGSLSELQGQDDKLVKYFLDPL